MPTRCERTRGARKRVNLPTVILLIAVLGILLPFLIAGEPGALAHNDDQVRVAQSPYRDGIVLMAFRDGIQAGQQKEILSSVGARELKRIGVGVHVVAVKPGHVVAAITSLKARQQVQYAEPDYLQSVSGASLPNDTLIGFQWAVQNTGQTVNGSSGSPGADERSLAAWGITTGTNSVVIAVLDTGVQYSHPDLITNMWNNPGGIGGCSAGTHGFNVLSSSCDPMDDDTGYGGHGTHVAGIIGAVGNDAAGTAGVNWTTSLMALKWVGSNGLGATSDLITAMDWVVSAKQSGVNVRIANDSQTWAGTAFSQALSDEIDLLGTNDILFVTASGNTAQNDDSVPRYPCTYNRPTEICVAASDQNDNLWSLSNFGSSTVKLAAPGANIYSTLRMSNYGYISGGSMASPQVAGTAGLILSLGYQPVSSLRSMILNNVDARSSLSGLVQTGGRLNVCKAVPGCSSAVAKKPGNSILPVVTSVPKQGGLIGASTGAWTGIPSTYTYQWSRCGQNGLNCSQIPGATGQTYALLAPADALATFVVTVTATNSFGSTAVQSSASSAAPSATSPSSISSSIVSGASINGSVAWIATPSRSEQFVQFFIDGVLNQTDKTSPYAYNASTTGLLDTTTLPNGPHVLGFRALASDNRTYDFFGETVTVANPPQNTAIPAISGTVVPPHTLSTSNGSWNANSAPTSFSYQWEHCDSGGLNCAAISGATGSSYTLSGADTNFTMRSAVIASNSGGSTTAVSAQTGVVPPPPLGITTSSLPGGTQNLPYSSTVVATGGVPPYSWSISSGALPTGLTLAPSSGVISGTTAVTGTSNFTVAVTDTASVTVTAPLSLTIAVPLTITTSSLPNGTQLAAYSATLAGTGGTPPYSWSISSGSLPSGLSLASSIGTVSGTSSVAGTSNFTVLLTDANSVTTTHLFSITINSITSGGNGIGLVQANAVQGSGVGSVSAAFPVSNTAGNLILAFVRMSSSLQTVTLSDSAGNTYIQAAAQVQNADGSQVHLFYAKNILGAAANTVTATFSSTNNHPFLAIDEFKGLSTTNPLDQTATAQGNGSTPSSGATPTTTSANELVFGAMGLASTYSGSQTAGSGFTMLENDTASSPAATEFMLVTSTGSYTASFTLSSNPNWTGLVATFATAGPVVTTTSLPNGMQNSAYSATLAAVGGTTPYTWSMSSGTLPAGLSLAPSTGVISGTSTATGTSNFTVQATDANSLTGAQPLSLTVVAPMNVTTSSLPNGTQNTAYNTTLAATGGTTPYTWSISAGTLPTGLSLASNTGVISGTPTGTGTSNFTVQVTDVNSLTAAQPLSLAVAGPVSVTTASLPNGTQNTAYNATLAVTGGTAPYSWSISSGTLPTGLSLASSTGVISGTPTGTGTSNFTVQVTDANSLTATKPLSLTVVAPLAVTTSSLPNGTQNAAYSTTLAATGGTTPYSWSISAGTLPAGLALAPSTGVISGTPTSTGTSNFTVQVTDANSLTAVQPLSLTVVAPPLTVTTSSLPNGTQNTAYNTTLAAVGGTTPYSWSISAGTLPTGLSLASSTGVISGTPTGTGTSNFTVQVTDANSVTASKPLSLTVVAPLTVTTSSLPNGTQNSAYSTTLAATGGTTPYTWSISAGTLPAGLALASSTGMISGTPTGTGTSNFTVKVTDANSLTATQPLSLTVLVPLTVSTTTLPNGTQNSAYNTTLAASGGTTPYSWSISSGTLPTGLSLASSTGVISGTPTGTGTSNFTVQVTDANSLTATKPLSLTVVAPLTVTTTTLPNGTQSIAYSTTLAATGGTTPYSWSISSGTLPTGLSLASSTGVISGTPSGTGTSNFTVQVTDANSLTAVQPLSLTVVAPPLTITTSSLPNGTQNTAYNTTLAAVGGTTPYSWSISAGTLPTGLSLASSTGVISGTPTGTGTSNFTVQVTDVNSVTASKPLSLTVVAPLTVSTSSLPNGTQNAAYSTTLAATGGTTPYTWSISAGTLPTGLALASNTGVISGTPTGTGTSNFTVKVTDANSLTATQPLSLTVLVPLTVTTTTLPNGTQNTAYNTTLAAVGGTTPYIWSISSGTLPTGLALAPSTGVISGTPTGTGTSNFTVQVTDANSLTAAKPLSLTITIAGGGIALVQQNAVQGSGVGSVSVAFPISNTSGNLILAFVRMSTTSQTVTLADSAGNTYVEAAAQAQTSDGSQIHLFYAKNSLGAPNTVTATFSSSNNHPWLAIYEFTGLNTINPLDQTAHAQGGNSSPNSGATPTTTSPNELVFAAMGLPSSFRGTQTAGAGFSFLQQDTATSPAANESMLVISTGSYAAAFTLNASANWTAIVATFKP